MNYIYISKCHKIYIRVREYSVPYHDTSRRKAHAPPLLTALWQLLALLVGVTGDRCFPAL